MKTLITVTFASFLLTFGYANPVQECNESIENTVSTISFSVIVNNGNSTLNGVTVSIIQNGKVISSGRTMRGKAQLYIDNEDPFDIRVEVNGQKPFVKKVNKVEQGQKITVDIKGK